VSEPIKTVSEAPKQETAVTEPLSTSQPISEVVTEAEAKAFIYFKESTNRTDAINPGSGACGLGQALPCNKMNCSLQDRECQDEWFSEYAVRRYGSWTEAKAFWLAHSWW